MTRVAGGIVFVVVFVVSLPVVWVGIGLAAALAYSGNPALESMSFGPSGWFGHVLGTVIFSALAAVIGAVGSRQNTSCL